jgi:hypothetical protein
MSGDVEHEISRIAKYIPDGSLNKTHERAETSSTVRCCHVADGNSPNGGFADPRPCDLSAPNKSGQMRASREYNSLLGLCKYGGRFKVKKDGLVSSPHLVSSCPHSSTLVFVGGVAEEVDEATIYEHFSTFGALPETATFYPRLFAFDVR